MVLREGGYTTWSLGKANIVHQLSTNNKQIMLWHHRLGHLFSNYMKHLFLGMFSRSVESKFECHTCTLAKSHRVPYPVSLNKSIIPFSLIHSDVWGPSPCSNTSGSKWFVTFIDDCTRMTWLYLMKHKSEFFNIFTSFHVMIKTQYSSKI